MSEPPFTGVAVALVTLFDDDGELDAAASAQHARRLVDRGVRAVVVAGTTGEALTLDPEERVRLLDAVRGAVSVPVLAGTGAVSIRQATELTRAAVDHGADGLLVLSPPGARDVRPYYEAVAGVAGDVPVLAYHFPAVSAPGIPVEALADLPVAGLKDSSGDAERLLHEVAEWGGPLYPGAATLLLLAGAVGCPGAILALANLEPEMCVAALAGDADAQVELMASHRATAGVPALKEHLAARYGTSRVCRVL